MCRGCEIGSHVRGKKGIGEKNWLSDFCSTGSRSGAFLRLLRLQSVSLDDRGDKARKAAFDLEAARGVVHLDAFALGADKSCFTKHLEVLREGRFWDGMLGNVLKGGAGSGTLR